MTNTFAFQDIFAHIDKLLATFSLEKSHAIAVMLDPVVTISLGIGWMLYGVMHWTGSIEEPFMAFIEKTIKTGLIVSAAVGVAGWNDLLIQTLQDSPVALAAALAGTTSTAGTTLNGMGVVLDGTVDNVLGISSNFFQQATWTDFYPVVLGALVLAVGIIVTIAAGFFIVLSKAASALILSLGPLFIFALLFEWSKNFFTTYMNTLIQYGLLGALAVGANSLILSMFQQVAQELVVLGSAATINECAALLITGGMGLLVLWQIPSLASGLAGGMSLSTFGIGRKSAGGAWNKASNKQGRDNQRDATNRIDVERRVDAIKDKAKPKPKENRIERPKMPRRAGANN